MPPQRNSSQQDVADLAKVSRTTVSLVLNNVESAAISDETRQRVLDAAKQLGYVPDAAAQALASRRSKIVGLVLARSTHHISSDAYLTQVLDTLVAALRAEDMRLIFDIVDGEHHRDAYLELIRSKRIDGIILSGPRYDDKAVAALEEEGFPTVLMGQLPGSCCTSVDVDNRAAARIAVEHLLKLGHRTIACITNAGLEYTAAVERLEGYREALSSAGIMPDETLIRYGDFNPESGFTEMNALLQVAHRPSAVFVASDVVAFGATAAIREAGLRIPQDIALVAFDNVPLSKYVQPALTTVNLPAKQLALEASRILLQLIRNEPVPEKRVLLETELIIRESCGAKNHD